MPVTSLQVPGSLPVTFSERPVRVPLTTWALLVTLKPTFAASGAGRVPQKRSYCWLPTYSSPVTRRQLPGSSPVTRSLRPTLVPVMPVPRRVLKLSTLAAARPPTEGSLPRYWSPVSCRPEPASSPVTFSERPTITPETERPPWVWLWATLRGEGTTPPQ